MVLVLLMPSLTRLRGSEVVFGSATEDTSGAVVVDGPGPEAVAADDSGADIAVVVVVVVAASAHPSSSLPPLRMRGSPCVQALSGIAPASASDLLALTSFVSFAASLLPLPA